MNRMALVFALALAVAVIVSLARPAPPAETNLIQTRDVSYRTSPAFNAGALGVLLILAVLYTIWW